MTVKGKVVTCLVVLFIGILLLSTPAWANRDVSISQQDPQPTSRAPDETSTETIIPVQNVTDPSDLPFIEKAAEFYGLSAENLQVEYKGQVDLPLTGQSFTYAKVLDQSSGGSFGIALNAIGKVVDADALRAAENVAYNATFGKLNPSLANDLSSLSPNDMVSVSIWLSMGGRDASLPRLGIGEASGMSREELKQIKTNNLARSAQIHQEVEQPLIDFIPTVGGRVISAATDAPLVFAELPVNSIQQVAALSYVLQIDLTVNGGPDQEIGENKPSDLGPEMVIAGPASKSNIVNARGINGSNVWTAVVEGDSINFGNPYIPDGTCGPNATCPNIQDHPSAVGGIIASTHTTYRGTAPGIGTHLLSANGGGYDLPSIQSATSWAEGMGVDVLNNSYFIETDGVMHNSDRYLDYIFRYSADLEVKSAGNRGLETDKYVTSPGLGYNTLTVASADDNNTLAWSDDTISAYSSYIAPSGRRKPDITAIGCNTYGVLGITITGMNSPWIYDQGCGTSYAAPIVSGGGALLIQGDITSSLYDWPEAQKAILLASALHNIEGASAYSQKDGAGAVDLAAADTIAANYWWNAWSLNPTTFDASGNFNAMTFHLYAGERVRIAFAYDSNPSADSTSDLLEADLDLYLLDPSGTMVSSSAGTDSWEIIEYTPTTEGDYTIRIHNFAGSLSGSEWTYGGLAVWPGHYVLAPYASQTRDKPPRDWNQNSGDDYRFTRGSFWNAVGIREAPADYDLFLFNNSVYGDPAIHTWLEDSTLSGLLDFVVVDGNHAPSGDYYTTVSAWSGTGNYTIQQATHSTDVGDGTFGPYTMTTSDVLRVWDSLSNNGTRKYFAIRPTTGDADLGMALFASDGSISTTYYQGRSQYVATADSNGASLSETMNYLPSATDWMGLVVWNNSSTTNTTYYLYADTTSPNGTISINNDAAYANSTTVTLNLSGVDPDTGVYQMRFSNDGSTWSSWEAYATSKAWTMTSGDGTKTVFVQYKNNAEMSSNSILDTIILDTTAPTGSIIINGGAAYTNSTSVNLTLSATDAGSGVSQMQFSNDGSSWSGWETYSISKAWTLPGGDGTKTVYVQYSDVVGNISNNFMDTINLDMNGPTGSIIINGGAAYTNSTSVNLTLAATDPGSGVSQMQFSNNGSTWSSWEAYSTSKLWTLTTGDGTKMVYVQINDLNGNISAVLADTIILDTIAPTANSSSPAQVMNLSFTVNWTASDAGSGVVAYDVQYRVGTGGAWTDWQIYTIATSAVFGPIYPVVIARGETYFFRVRAYDGAGNLGNYHGGDGDTSTYIILQIFLPITIKP
jgi:hypothetical protein